MSAWDDLLAAIFLTLAFCSFVLAAVEIPRRGRHAWVGVVDAFIGSWLLLSAVSHVIQFYMEVPK